MHAGKEEKLVLIKEVASTHALQEVDQVATKQFKQQVIALQRQRRINDHKEAFIDEVLQGLEGEAVADMFDFLSKELIRLQEERRIHAFAMLAERQRRMREAEESGLRQVEERRRREEDEIFKQILKTQQESVVTYLEDCILESTNKVADDKARKEIQEMATKINDVAYEMEEKYELFFHFFLTEFCLYKKKIIFFLPFKRQSNLEKEEIVAELVHGFLIPEAQKQIARQQGKVLFLFQT